MSEKIEKIKTKFMNFVISSEHSLIKFIHLEAIITQLMALITR